MTPARKAEIRALLNAATPGPWRWFGNTAVKNLYLATVHHGRRFVMVFERWGMRDACPAFQVPISPNNGMMVRADTMVKYERPYRKDVDGIDHPDARLIEQAPTLIGELLAATDDDAAELARLRDSARVLLDALNEHEDASEEADRIDYHEDHAESVYGAKAALHAALAATTPTDPPAAFHGSMPHDTNGDIK